jgi:hypothetical protein
MQGEETRGGRPETGDRGPETGEQVAGEEATGAAEGAAADADAEAAATREAAGEPAPGDAEPEAGQEPEDLEVKRGLTPELQAKFDARIGKYAEKARLAREEAETARAAAAAATGDTPEQRLAVAQAVGLDPAYIAKPEAALVTKVNALQAEEDRLVEHPDGIEDEDPSKAMTAVQVQKRLVVLRREMAALQPRAQAAYDAGLKLQMRDMEEGRKLRLARAAAARGKPATERPTGMRPVRAGVRVQQTIMPPGKGGLNRKKYEASGRTTLDLIESMT